MPAIKPKRRYNAAHRRRQAGETRRRILEAAELLFAERGYAPTTMHAIAAGAGVAPDTVYASFGSKRAVLHGVVEMRVGVDEQQEALVERAGPRSALAETDVRKLLSAFAAEVAEILERASVVGHVLRSAAAADADAAGLLREMEDSRWASLRSFARAVAGRARLRRGLDISRAGTVIWVLASPDVHRLLRIERGWSAAEYAGWLADSLVRTLLD